MQTNNAAADTLFAGNEDFSRILSKHADAQSLRVQNWGTFWQGTGQIFGASGKFGEAELGAQAKEIEAEGQRLAAAAEMTRGEADIDKDVLRELLELLKAIISFIEELRKAQVNEMGAITKG